MAVETKDLTMIPPAAKAAALAALADHPEPCLGPEECVELVLDAALPHVDSRVKFNIALVQRVNALSYDALLKLFRPHPRDMEHELRTALIQALRHPAPVTNDQSFPMRATAGAH